jgi:hypothetical protein
LIDQLRAYATSRSLSFVDDAYNYEFHWVHKGSERFIEIDKRSFVIRAGKILRRTHLPQYLSTPAYLGTDSLEEILDRLRKSADGRY